MSPHLHSLTPFPALLHQHSASGQWDSAIRLCRFAKVGHMTGPICSQIAMLMQNNYCVIVLSLFLSSGPGLVGMSCWDGGHSSGPQHSGSGLCCYQWSKCDTLRGGPCKCMDTFVPSSITGGQGSVCLSHKTAAVIRAKKCWVGTLLSSASAGWDHLSSGWSGL